MIFKENSYGGIDIYNEKQKFLAHLNDDDIKAINNIQQKTHAVNTVISRIFDWVRIQIENDDGYFADFNSQLYSKDEISAEEICQNILADKNLIEKIANEYREIRTNPLTAEGLKDWAYADEAIGEVVSIEAILGNILREKYPKEFHIGKWRVAVVEKGDFYGVNRALQYENDKPIVDFYDMSQDKEHFPNGQFTGGQYYIETLLTTDIYSSSISDMAKQGIGLSLHGDVPSWTVAPGELAVIGAWLNAVQKHYELTSDISKLIYRGEVDVPYGYYNLENINMDSISATSRDMLLSRLKAIPEFENVNVEWFGEYKDGNGFTFSFVALTDKESADALLHHVLNGLKYEVEATKSQPSLENTLTDAQERSQKQNNKDAVLKDDFDIGK